jgi:hypothetical protein
VVGVSVFWQRAILLVGAEHSISAPIQFMS